MQVSESWVVGIVDTSDVPEILVSELRFEHLEPPLFFLFLEPLFLFLLFLLLLFQLLLTLLDFSCDYLLLYLNLPPLARRWLWLHLKFQIFNHLSLPFFLFLLSLLLEQDLLGERVCNLQVLYLYSLECLLIEHLLVIPVVHFQLFKFLFSKLPLLVSMSWLKQSKGASHRRFRDWVIHAFILEHVH